MDQSSSLLPPSTHPHASSPFSPKSPVRSSSFPLSPTIYHNNRKILLHRVSRLLRQLRNGSVCFKLFSLILFISIFCILLISQTNNWIQIWNNLFPNQKELKLHRFYASKINSMLVENKRLKMEVNILSKLQQTSANDNNAKLNNTSDYDKNRFKSFYFGNKSTELIAYYDMLQARMESTVQDLWNFANDRLDVDQRHSDRKYLYEMRLLMGALVDELGTRDRQWRHHRQLQLAITIREKIEMLQNPANCFESKKLFCPVDKRCGFGCLVHHLAYCLTAAMAFNRTLILTRSYRLPIESTYHSIDSICSQNRGSLVVSWESIDPMISSESFDKIDSIELPFVDFLAASKLTNFRPLAVPEQLAPLLTELSQNPFVLFVGHILDYVLQPTELMTKRFNSYWDGLGLSVNDTFVGIHVRRTDKLEYEGKYHPLSQYMAKVDEYYDQIDLQLELRGMNQTLRRIYLATDDQNLWKKELPEYSKQKDRYQFFGSEQFSAHAIPEYRARINSMEELAIDVWILSLSDYLVCTFSSQICRLAYELMQVRRPRGRDMSIKAFSLDDPYYYGGQLRHGLRSFLSNRNSSKNEHSFSIGSILGIERDLANGYLRGDLHYQNIYRGSMTFPKYKVVEDVVTYPFRLFDEQKDAKTEITANKNVTNK